MHNISAGDALLGDPGLLLGELGSFKTAKSHKYCFVPHYKDDFEVRRRFSHNMTIISVTDTWHAVVSRIASCTYVFSTSLHGLIAADALEVPSRWVQLSDLPSFLTEKSFKFQDYYSVFSRELATPLMYVPNDRISEYFDKRIPKQLIRNIRTSLELCFPYYLFEAHEL